MDKPAAREFTITLDGIDIRVSYQAKRFHCHDHFEFRSLNGKPIPISETGYLSQFVIHEIVERIGGAEAYAKTFAEAMLTGGMISVPGDMPDEEPQEPQQLGLFS